MEVDSVSLRRFILGSFVTLASLSVWAQTLQDGPHVFWQGREPKVVNVVDGKLVEEKLGPHFTLALAGMVPVQISPDGPAIPPEVCTDATKVLAISDIHGNGGGFRRLLRAHHVVDDLMQWSFGDGHLVVVGDVADRGPDITSTYWFLRSLHRQASLAGGGVHFVLGNHEVMILQGDTRYSHPKYQQQLPALLGRDMSGLVARDTELGRWLRAQHALVQVGSHLFVHGGVSKQVLAAHMDLKGINRAFRGELNEYKPGDLLKGPGPVWYRGLIPGVEKKQPEATTQDVEALLKRFKVKGLVVGHTTLPQVTAFHEGKVFGIDAGLKDGKPGEVWIWDEGKAWRGLVNGTRVPFEAPALPKAAGL